MKMKSFDWLQKTARLSYDHMMSAVKLNDDDLFDREFAIWREAAIQIYARCGGQKTCAIVRPRLGGGKKKARDDPLGWQKKSRIFPKVIF